MALKGSAYSKLSKRERSSTPFPFARYLIDEVRRIHRCTTVAALWVQPLTIYLAFDDIECWTEREDARTYAGPYPVIAHPPCGAWGSMAHWNKHHPYEDALIALDIVHQFGGVLEHPTASRIFKIAGTGRRTYVNQSDYGFSCPKPTGLYWVDNPTR